VSSSVFLETLRRGVPLLPGVEGDVVVAPFALEYTCLPGAARSTSGGA